MTRESRDTRTEALDIERMRLSVAEMLDMVAHDIGDDDDLLRLGMDSIQVIRLANQWRRAGAEIGSADLMELRTLGEWAALVTAREQVAPADHRDVTVDPSQPFALAPMQHAYWVGRSDGQVLGGVGAQFYCEFNGTGTRLSRLDTAVRTVIQRHGMLRSRFLADGRAQISPDVRWSGVTVHDLRAHSVAEARDEAERIRHRLSQRRLDVDTGQVLDVALTLFPDGGTRTHIAVDMLVCDGRSFQILMTDLAAAYLRPDLSPAAPTLSFPTYLALRSAGRTESFEARRARDERYWARRLADLPPAPALPLRVDPGQIVGRHHLRRSHTIASADRERLAGHARAHGVLLSMVFVAAFAEVIGGWSATPRFLLNLPFYDRDSDLHREADTLVGDFTNLVLLAVDVTAERGFADRVLEVQRQFHTDLAHTAYTGVDVLRDLARIRPDAGSSAPVVFTTAINLGELFDENVREAFGSTGYTMSTTPQVWLDCQVTQRDGGLFVSWDAVEELFADGVVDDMFAAYVRLLDALIDGDWSTPVGSLTPQRTLHVRAKVNATAGALPDRQLHTAFFEHARCDPDRVALHWQESTLSYGTLADTALRVAASLVAVGVGPGDLVAVTLPRGPDQVAAVLGVLAAGGAYVPVGPHQPQARRATVYVSAGVHVVLTDTPTASTATWPSSVTALAIADALLHPPLARLVTEQVTADGASADDLAYVIYTSGSTGEPKGVEISHRSAGNTVLDINERFAIGAEDRVLALSNLDFDLSVYDLFGPLSVGGRVVLITEDDQRDAASWVERVRRHGVTVWNSVPALLDMALVAGRLEPGWCRTVRLVLLSGDWIGLDLPGRLREQGPSARLIAMGGATEASIWSNAFEVDDVPAHWRSIPYGFPLRNQQFRAVDVRGRDCPDWVTGELWIGGVGVARGYRGDPQRTAEQFVDRDGLRWYRTGDTGRYWPDATLEFLGRRDAQVKIRGHRIELGEVEATLAGHPAVVAAVAVVMGRAPGRLAAIVVIDPAVGSAAPSPDGLRQWCGLRLPTYMVPEHIAIADAVPLTDNAKVDRARVSALLAGVTAHRRAYQPPVGPVELAVAAIWSDLLAVATIDRYDTFFALGGDSLDATRLLGRLGAAGLVGGQLRTLLTRPALADFAATLRPGTSQDDRRVVVADPEHRHEPFPPTDVQRAYWIGRTDGFALGGVGSHWYWELDGSDVDIGRLEAAWNHLVGRHEMLRAVFDDDGNQRILADVAPTRIAVTEVPAVEADPALDQLRRDLAHRVADPNRWPLIEIRAVRYGDRVRLAFSFDYIVLDALSIVTVFNELSALYRDPTTVLAANGLSFRDYVVAGGPDPDELRGARDYWRRRAAFLPGPPRLPLHTDPATVHAPRFTRRELRLDPPQWMALSGAGRRHGLTPSSVLATAYAEVLGAWSPSDELTLNLTLFDRRDVHPDVNATLGDFTSLLLAAYVPRAGETFVDAATRLQEQIWTDLQHRAVSAIWVLRERARQTGATDVAMPVVFTSALGLPAELVGMDLPFGRPVWGLSQTPQVWLDCQVTERDGGLAVSWDAAADLFTPGVLDEMFAGFRRLLLTLADGGDLVGLDRSAIRARVSAPTTPAAAPVPITPPARAVPAQGPSGSVETSLAAIWADLLQHPGINRDDNFFSLGGDSLLATHLVTRVRHELGVAMSMRLLLGAPVLAELATVVAGQLADDTIEEGVV